MTKREQFWADHLQALAEEGMTTSAYAQREGLSVQSLYDWRWRLKRRKASKDSRASSFVKARVVSTQPEPSTCSLSLGEGMTMTFSQVPSPEWLWQVCHLWQQGAA